MRVLMKFLAMAGLLAACAGQARAAGWDGVAESSCTVVLVSVASHTATALDSSSILGGRRFVTISSATDLFCGFASADVSTATGRGFIVTAVTGSMQLNVGSNIRLFCQHTAGGATTKPVSLGQCR